MFAVFFSLNIIYNCLVSQFYHDNLQHCNDNVTMKLLFSYWCKIFIFYFYFQEQENFFYEHFGMTPNSNPAASQVTDHEDSSNDADDDGPADDTIDLDRRLCSFLMMLSCRIQIQMMEMNTREAHRPLRMYLSPMIILICSKSRR